MIEPAQDGGPTTLPTEEPRSAARADSQPRGDNATTTVRVALPAYNEEEALLPLLESLDETLRAMGVAYEIVVVDDGSVDATAEIASRASFSMPVRLVSHEVNQGLAGALRTGLLDAVSRGAPGDVVVVMDADNTQPAGLLPRMLGMVREGHDVVIASRFRPGARVIGVPLERAALSVAARYLFRFAFPIRGVRDYTCGYRAYRVEALAATVQRYGDRFVTERGFSCMVDVLLKMRKTRLAGGPIVMGEAPMILRYDQKGGESKMRVARTIGQTLSLILRRLVTG